MPDHDGVIIDPPSLPEDSEPRPAVEVGAAVRRGCEEVAPWIRHVADQRMGNPDGYPPESGTAADAIPIHAPAGLDGVHPCCGRRRPDGYATTQTTIPADVTCEGPSRTPTPAAPGPVVARRFTMERTLDVSGVSGTGMIAFGVQWPDGTVVLRWVGPHASTVVWDSITSVEATHGHGGSTTIWWVDE